MILFVYILLAIGILTILIRPHCGIILLFVSVALTETLSEFPFLNSVFAIWGVAAIMGFMVKSFQRDTDYIVRPEPLYLVALLFIFWMFISNPEAGMEGDERNWIFTFIQLLVLAWLTGVLMDTNEKFHSLMFWFALALVGSAIFGIINSSIESTRMSSDIEAGLLGGKNAASRYYIVASLFSFYLQKIETNKFKKFMLLVMMLVLITGVLFTLSRAGLGLLVMAIFLVAIKEFRFNWKQLISWSLFLVALAMVVPEVVYDAYLSVISGQEFETGGRGAEYSSIENNIRYTLWWSGLDMWASSPITGIGIGQFPILVAAYLPFSLAYLELGAHNMFIQILAETGTVGFIMFMGLLWLAFTNFRVQIENFNTLSRIWMIAFIIMVLGGIMKHDHYDKLLWLLIGASVALKNYSYKIKTYQIEYQTYTAK